VRVSGNMQYNLVIGIA